jgi:hypothetical protein
MDYDDDDDISGCWMMYDAYTDDDEDDEYDDIREE